MLLRDQSQVSNFRGMPVNDIGASQFTETISGETVQFYYNNSGVLAVDSGQAIGTLIVAQLNYGGVKNQLGSMQGTFRDTSLSFSSTALTDEREFPYEKAESLDNSTSIGRMENILEGFSNGEYCVDYTNGLIYAKKASTQTELTNTTYKIQHNVSSSGSTVVEKIDLNKVAGTSTAVNSGNLNAGTQRITIATDDINISAIKTAVEVMDDWDESDRAKVNPIVGQAGVAAGAGAVGATVQRITLASDDPAVVDLAAIEVLQTAGNASLDDIETVLEDVHDNPANLIRTAEQDPLNFAYQPETVAAVTNGTDGTYNYYVDLATFRKGAIQLLLDGGAGTVTVTVEGTCQDDGTAPASCTYVDITNAVFGAANFTASNILFDKDDFFAGLKYLKIKVVASTGGANNADWTIMLNKVW